MSALLPIVIEPVRPEDLPAVLEIERASHVDPWRESFFVEELERPHALMLVAHHRTDRRRIVGYICVWLVADEVQIFNLAVDPALRRRGIGRRLLLAALQHACQRNARVALLEVRRSNYAAQQLYLSLGFRPCGVRPNYYDGLREPAVLMELEMDRIWRSRWFNGENAKGSEEGSC
ncbi:ribosomal protein S18-alanine N-acetyltransferase [Desulfosoma caldarium]|uniref:Ribosomal-protein-alanine N-acetyltransferase n=1 Tax=Desulfosoma caldarium TaxID=610254 RepID=A0A3N1ULR0_9BACT|nr:ribosomal protein S18-alanine N-acetyltransferase [Desulfosoma caldarium]ROQ91023.1 ribosomal-protein-alanine N-acetyltransferase [Desulfosoma caldarium]